MDNSMILQFVAISVTILLKTKSIFY